MSKNNLKLCLLYTGTLIGAGFASGSEIAVYFLKYSGNFILSLFISCLIISLFGALTVSTAFKIQCFDYTDFMNAVVGDKASGAICFFTGVFFFVLFTAMISAFGSLCEDSGIMESYLARLIFLLFCIPVFLKGTQGLVKANCVLVPVLVIGMVVSSLAVIGEKGFGIFDIVVLNKSENYVKSIEFAFYNMVSCVPVLIECAANLKKETKPLVSCTLTGIIIFIIGLLIGISLLLKNDALNRQIPMLYVTENISGKIYLLYSISFIFSVYTTAASNGYCAMEWFLNKSRSKLKIIAFLAGAYFVSMVSFAVFVEKFYVIFSLIGLAELVFLIGYRLKL